MGLFRILGEGSVAAGVRRIEAVSGEIALALSVEERDQLGKIGSLLRADGGPLAEQTAHLIGERDALYDGCTDTDGVVLDTNDRDALAELDQLIDDNQAVIKASGVESFHSKPNAVVQADIANARSRGE